MGPAKLVASTAAAVPVEPREPSAGYRLTLDAEQRQAAGVHRRALLRARQKRAAAQVSFRSGWPNPDGWGGARDHGTGIAGGMSGDM